MSKRSKILKEFIWLIAILGIATLLEFAIIEILNLHPVLSIKIQGLIGLMLIGYGIRMGARIWKSYHNQADPNTNGKEVLE
ncbi:MULTISPECIES: hypothetical protein [Gracilimonas]|uniref:Uncharacterized protein n=1 Tax=Gracilimonas sediminicola TaxID=2952158 RepID=A0A9X2RGJ3_9BACT|nr:hypothetical protein [Gracilimonas sediminicola]MCP9290984.1 hypothetical protein [Gracilimonas sediminicola]